MLFIMITKLDFDPNKFFSVLQNLIKRKELRIPRPKPLTMCSNVNQPCKPQNEDKKENTPSSGRAESPAPRL